MLFGNMIFIKKTGGDGSKYPVTQRNIKIGRSEDCLIRIYNPQVAPEHCQLIIDDNGQAKLRNLSYCTILNGKPLSQGDVTLCHGDVFKLGERLARWEYLSNSKYYKQPLSPTGRLVAVVMPQLRSAEETAGTSTSQVSVIKSTPVGSKRRYSERVTSEGGSAKKISRLSSTSKTHKSKSNVAKFLAGRHSFKGTRALLQGPKVKQRKSTSGVISVKTPKTEAVEKSRKSTLPSWKVNIVTPPSKEKSAERKSTTSRISTPIATEKLVKSMRKSAVKPSLRTIVESPQKQAKESPKSKRSSTKAVLMEKASVSTPSDQMSKPVRLIHSEKKLKSVSAESQKLEFVQLNRRSLVLKKVKTPLKSEIIKLNSSGLEDNVKSPRRSKIKAFDSDVLTQTLAVVNLTDCVGSVTERHTPRKSQVSAGKNSTTKRTEKSVKTPKTVAPSSLRGEKLSPDPDVVSARMESSGNKSLTQNAVILSTPGRGRPSGTKNISSAKRSSSTTKQKSTSPRGVRRKSISPISSAERAAKRLKTSSPRKPDKNKKAALLVLGKANRKQLLSQNVKVLLKQKIVKKAIKQSVMPPVRKDDSKVRKGSTKVTSKRKKKLAGKNVSSERKKSVAVSKFPTKLLSSETNVEVSPKNKSVVENSLGTSILSSLTSPKQGRKTVSSVSGIISSKSTPIEKDSPIRTSDKTSESYLFASNRRSSKRLSSKNDTSRPDFMELSPTALGLIPKTVEIFKTPKVKKRSSVVTTPVNVRTSGIIKSASTSKIKQRKSVRFSSKNVPRNSLSSAMESSNFDLDHIQTPNISVDVFVSPLLENSKNSLNESSKVATDKSKGTSPTAKITSTPKKCVRKLLQFPQPQVNLERVSPDAKSGSPRDVVAELLQVPKVEKQTKNSKVQKSPKNDLSDLRGVRRLLRTPSDAKSPKNDLTDVKGVKKLFRTPKVQKSPKNDLTDVKGVKKLLQTPKVQKSPKNDLTDVRGVKKLLQTPKVQKSPKNDLTDVKGVKKLLQTPKVQKSPKNDLTDVVGVAQLFQNALQQKSPKNDLSDVRGVRRLLRTPKEVKSPKNDLTDLRGVRNLLGSPKVQRSPRNDLSDVRGVKRLLQSPRNQRSPRNDLMDVSGVEQLFESPTEKSLEKGEAGVEENSEIEQISKKLTPATGVRQLMVAKSLGVGSSSKKSARKSRVSDLRAVRGRRAINSSAKGRNSPKNDLSDVAGVRELFARHKPAADFEVNLAGVAELFELSGGEAEGLKQTLGKSSQRKSAKATVVNVEEEEEEEEEMVTRGRRTRRAPKEVETRATRRRKEEDTGTSITVIKEVKSTKRKATEEMKSSETKKSVSVSRTTTTTRGRKAQTKTSEESPKEDQSMGRVSRKRKALELISDPSPPNLRRKRANPGTSSKVVTFEMEAPELTETEGVKRGRKKAPAKVSASKGSKTSSKVQTKTSKTTRRVAAKASTEAKDIKSPKTTSRVQKKSSIKTAQPGESSKAKVQIGRSQNSSRKKLTESEEKISPRKTRGVRVKIESQEKKNSKTKTTEIKMNAAGKTRAPQISKRSTRGK